MGNSYTLYGVVTERQSGDLKKNCSRGYNATTKEQLLHHLIDMANDAALAGNFWPDGSEAKMTSATTAYIPKMKYNRKIQINTSGYNGGFYTWGWDSDGGKPITVTDLHGVDLSVSLGMSGNWVVTQTPR